MQHSVPGFALSPGVSFCFEGDHVIILDQIADRYLALAEPQRQAFKTICAGELIGAADRTMLDALVAQGLLMPTAQAHLPQPCCEQLPAEAIRSSPSNKVPAMAQLSFAWRVMVARRSLKRRGLHRTLQWLDHQRKVHAQPNPQPMAALHQASDLLALIGRFMTRLDQCLPISLGLAHYLLRQGIECKVVLGIQLGPFCAHCWVQHGDHLLGDDLDVVRTFTPILVA